MLGLGVLLLGVAIYLKKDFLDEFLSRQFGKYFSVPVGVVKYTCADGRSKGALRNCFGYRKC